MTTADAALDRLDRLLDEERALVRAGRLEDLADLLARKEALVDRLADRAALGPTRQALRDKIARNQRLLEGALAGLGDVARRLDQVREARSALETYGSDGRRAPVGAPGSRRMERRA